MRLAGSRTELRLPSWVARGDAPADGARTSGVPALVVAAGALAIAFALVLRFWTRSDLWLDEALTVNVARVPLHQLPEALKRDGAPPLYYVLLHFWMRWFGTGDLAVRSLSGVFGVLCLPLVWFAGRRAGGRTVAWSALFLLASSPFAVRYSTENRMYSLVIFLTLVGYLALVSVLHRPRPANVALLALSVALLLYTHYWGFYVVLVVGVLLLFMASRGSREPLWAIAALAVGCVAFVPWLPVFVYQLRHTGTPWAAPASFSAIVHAVGGFGGGDPSVSSAWDASPTRGLGLIFFLLGMLAIFGVAIDRRRIELDLYTRPRARALTFVVALTLILAVVIGLVSSSTFIERYTAVVFAPFILLMALGTVCLADRRVRYGLVSLAVVLGLSVSYTNVHT